MNSKKTENGKRKTENKRRYFSHFPFTNFHFPLICCLLLCACQPGARIINSGRENVNSPSPSAGSNKSFDSYEKDLETMRTADFDYVYVFRRRDGAIFNGEDKKFLKANSPASTNRFILSDEDKAVIAGSKFKFAPENLEALRSYFVIEDYSKPANQNAPDANVNGKINAGSQ